MDLIQIGITLAVGVVGWWLRHAHIISPKPANPTPAPVDPAKPAPAPAAPDLLDLLRTLIPLLQDALLGNKVLHAKIESLEAKVDKK
jgi:hypothetical protein